MLRKTIEHFLSERKGLACQFLVFPKSITGQRESNQDNYLILTEQQGHCSAQWLKNEQPVTKSLPSWPKGWVRIAIADGVGGQKNGQEIAQAAMESLLRFTPATTPQEMRDLVNKVHCLLRERFYTGKKQSPGTTLLLFDICLKSRQALVANVGDSRAYLVNDEHITQLTHDHTSREFDYRAKDISRSEYKEFLQQPTNKIAQSLGNGSWGLFSDSKGHRFFRHDKRLRLDLAEELHPRLKSHADVFEFHLNRKQSIILATDGLWDCAPQACWKGPCTNNFLSETEVNAQIERAVKSESKDNTTVVIFGFK